MDDEADRKQVLYYKHVLVRGPDGKWVFYGAPIAFTLSNDFAARAVVEVTIREAISESPWANIPHDFVVISASRLEAFALFDTSLLGEKHGDSAS